jgi:hypothetical protein
MHEMKVTSEDWDLRFGDQDQGTTRGRHAFALTSHKEGAMQNKQTEEDFSLFEVKIAEVCHTRASQGFPSSRTVVVTMYTVVNMRTGRP